MRHTTKTDAAPERRRSAFAHPTYRAEGEHLVCLACGAAFSPVAPHLPRTAQRALRDTLQTPRKRRAPRRAGASSLETAGLAALTAPATPAPRSATMGVRFYYHSEGGEVLAFDAGPLTPDAARRLLDAHTTAHYEQTGVGFRGRAVFGYVRRPTSDCASAVLITWRDRRPAGPILGAGAIGNAACAAPEGARVVVLPSQATDPVQVVEIAAERARVERAPPQLRLFEEVLP